MDGRRRFGRSIEKAGSGVVTREQRIAATHRRSRRVRRFLARNPWVLPSAKYGFMALIAGGLVGAAVATDVPGRAQRQLAALMEKTGFTVRQVSLTGHKEQSGESILSALNVPIGTALWHADLVAAHERIAELPWVKDVTLERVAPDTLLVTLVERKPVALWQKDEVLYAIDAGGEVIEQVSLRSHSGLFHIVGDEAGPAAPRFFKALYEYPKLVSQVKAAQFVSGRRWNLHFDNHVVAELPDGDVAAALARLDQLIEEEALFDRAFEVIDMRDPDRPRLRGAERVAFDKEVGDEI